MEEREPHAPLPHGKCQSSQAATNIGKGRPPLLVKVQGSCVRPTVLRGGRQAHHAPKTLQQTKYTHHQRQTKNPKHTLGQVDRTPCRPWVSLFIVPHTPSLPPNSSTRSAQQPRKTGRYGPAFPQGTCREEKELSPRPTRRCYSIPIALKAVLFLSRCCSPHIASNKTENPSLFFL